jgi:hypothetical protein
LRSVQELFFNEAGAWAVDGAGDRLLDVHHLEHPRSRNRRGLNGISIGFFGHYEKMQAYFGPHMQPGIAGENLIVDSPVPYTLADLQPYLVAVCAASGQEYPFRVLDAMAPCDPFTHFAARAEDRLPKAELKAGLQFLSNGRRGFLLQPLTTERIAIKPGDTVYLAE